MSSTASRDTILSPGEYLVELEFERPVDPDTLTRALTGMGWGLVVFDQSEISGVRTGAVSRSALSSSASSSTSKAPAPSGRSTVQLQTRATPAMTVVTQRTLDAASAANPARVRAPAPPAQPAPSLRANFQIQAEARLPSYVAPAVVMKPKPPPPQGPHMFGPNDVLTPKKPEEPQDPGPGQDPSSAAAPGGGGGGGYASSDQAPPEDAYAQPETEAASPTPLPVVDDAEAIKAVLVDLWRRWKEWGSPFAIGPSANLNAVQTSGAAPDTRTRLRFVGQLHRALSLNDVPGLLRWLFVKRLGVPTFTDLSLAYKPHPLVHGRVYEMRFLSRAKSEATKEAVKKGLGTMGFLPMKLFALKRHMRMPGREGASLTLWYGIAQWGNADSLVVGDDPFFFEDLKEVTL